jgi:hypothetical protein
VGEVIGNEKNEDVGPRGWQTEFIRVVIVDSAIWDRNSDVMQGRPGRPANEEAESQKQLARLIRTHLEMVLKLGFGLQPEVDQVEIGMRNAFWS